MENEILFRHRIEKAFCGQGTHRFQSFGRDCNIGWGCDSKPPGDDYFLEGLKGRSGKIPRALFQFTLDGNGMYREKRRRWKMGFGQSFMVVHPSRYTYWLPKGCHWGFFWLIVQHPVFVERIRLLRQKEIAVQTWEPGSPPLEAAATLIEALCHNQVPDIWAFEKLLFNWLWETERELYTRRHPGQLQQQWQDEIRQMVLGRLDHPPGVPDLAAVHKMERTTFSRKFKAATGQSPAAFILEVRMQEVLKRMRSPATLAEIASATGFPDAPRFSKTFRRHFGVPPGIHRNFILNRR